MVQIVCQNDVVTSHPFAYYCQSTLEQIAERDYCRAGWFDERTSCLSLDEYETAMRTGSNNCTMDAAIGIGNYENNRVTTLRLMLVELRMGYENTENLSVSSLDGKINHSRNLLSGCSIDSNNYFIFMENVSAQAKNWAERKRNEGGVRNSWVMLSVDEFNLLIHFVEDMPYVPKTDLSQLRDGLEYLVAGKKWHDLCEQSDYWRKKALDYKYRYEIAEFESICVVLLDVWKDVEPDQLGLGDLSDDYIELCITKEDLLYLEF